MNSNRICRMALPAASALAVLLAAAAAAQERAVDFEGADALASWEIKGDAALDPAKARAGTSLRVGPGAQAALKLRAEDGAGVVKLWVFDDGTAPEDPKANRVAAHWGVVNAEGRLLAAGPFCARYLSGDTAYSAAEYTPARRESPFQRVAHLGVRREAGKWREWTFRFDPDQGLAILVDGRNVNAQRQRYDWNKSSVGGFAGIVIVGDRAAGRAQTIHVDDISVQLGGAMNVKPAPPAAAEPAAAPSPTAAAPVADPPLESPAARLRPEVAAIHPRLLFGAEDLPKLRENYRHESMTVYRDAFLGYAAAARKVPETPAFQTDATEGQRQGLWRMPTVAYHWLMTGDEASLASAIGYLKFLAAVDHWETKAEVDSGMSSANVLAGAALVYDWVNDRLDPEFRETFRRKLIEMARRQYNGGHLMKNPGVHYWQNDPQNNHRWHRNAGLVLAALAGYGGPQDDWILTKAVEDLRFVLKWLPDDGTSHESPTYLIFGGLHLQLAAEAAARCVDPAIGESPFIRNVGLFSAQTVAPGLDQYFFFGDSAGSPGSGYANFLYRGVARHRHADVQALLDTVGARRPQSQTAWVALLWRDPTLAGGSVNALPKRALFPDLGLTMVRDGWEAANVGLMFKCGPLGGFKLNEYRNANGFKYINVAHDDPDANSFILFGGGGYLADTDRYAKQKQSASHNTILVNGRGQAPSGRPDIGGWAQPATGNVDMTERIRLTAWKAADGVVIAEGEAAGAYAPLRANGGRAASPGLERFRRAVIWVEGRYVLVLDDVRPKGAADIAWLIQAKKVDATEAAAGRYALAHDKASAALHLVSDQPIEGEIVDSPAEHRGEALGLRQLRAHARRVPAVRFAAVLTPWGGAAEVRIAEAAPEAWTFEVKTADGTDRWTWTASPYPDAPYGLEGRRADGSTVRVTADDKAPIE